MYLNLLIDKLSKKSFDTENRTQDPWLIDSAAFLYRPLFADDATQWDELFQ